MKHITKIAFLNSFTAISTLLVAFFLIGTEAMKSPEVLLELAQRNPLPIIIQDFLKVIMAFCGYKITRYFHIKLSNVSKINLISFFGYLSAFLLIINALTSFSLIYLSHILNPAATNIFLMVLAFLSLITGGIWLLLINFQLLKRGNVNKSFAYLGIIAGATSLPIISIISLVFSAFWFFYLGAYTKNNSSF